MNITGSVVVISFRYDVFTQWLKERKLYGDYVSGRTNMKYVDRMEKLYGLKIDDVVVIGRWHLEKDRRDIVEKANEIMAQQKKVGTV